MTVSPWQAEAGAPPVIASEGLRPDAPSGTPAGLPATADVAIVGGGLAGCSVAFALQGLDPSLKTVVVEGARLAAGASGRNAGFVLRGADVDYATTVDLRGRDAARRLWQATNASRRTVAALDPERTGYRRCGTVTAAGDAAEAARLVRSKDLLAGDGVQLEFAEDARAWTGGVGFRGALLDPEGGAVHPVRLVQTLAAQSRARIVQGQPVTVVVPQGAGWRVETPGEACSARAVVLALNAFGPGVWPGLERFVRPVRAQMLMTAPQPPVLARPVYSHGGYHYLRQLATGEVLLGGARHRWRDAEVGLEDTTTPGLQADLEAYLARHYPALKGAEVVRRWSGPMGFSPDGLPTFGALEPGLVALAGFTGHGLALAPRLGLLAARHVLGLPDGLDDLFAPDRPSLKTASSPIH